jgi:hypothetical protein
MTFVRIIRFPSSVSAQAEALLESSGREDIAKTYRGVSEEDSDVNVVVQLSPTPLPPIQSPIDRTIIVAEPAFDHPSEVSSTLTSPVTEIFWTALNPGHTSDKAMKPLIDDLRGNPKTSGSTIGSYKGWDGEQWLVGLLGWQSKQEHLDTVSQDYYAPFIKDFYAAGKGTVLNHVSFKQA